MLPENADDPGSSSVDLLSVFRIIRFEQSEQPEIEEAVIRLQLFENLVVGQRAALEFFGIYEIYRKDDLLARLALLAFEEGADLKPAGLAA